ncbi:DNA-processing protein DprA [Motiliproteus sp. SC1-56]|uniref:DNA-processing protein DprA n=1 Tax=Motiliproteus sp. SC1-56 TaxID=2799565 RepID=UPI001A8E0004|nr:DNA-processing protein DprA [Motiliproteus sp. SC1-56]
MDEHVSAWLRLSRVSGLGPRALKQLRETLGSPQAVLAAPPSQLQALGLRPAVAARVAIAAQQPLPETERIALHDWLAAPDHHLLCPDDPRYPSRLWNIPDPPPCLYVAGDPEVLVQPQLALVGSRHATISGLEAARDFGRALSQAGFVVTSGLALGIDGEAHRGALEGLGVTLGVLGSGCDRPYPARHRSLAESIVAAGGALVSELPLQSPPRAQNFPRRNRIISGLSLGVLVIEAAQESGSLITARLALEQGREVFAMPGSIHNPAARGCHRLIRQGAKLVETVDHILEEVAPQLPFNAREDAGGDPTGQEEEPLESGAARVLAACGYDTTPLDRVVERSGLSAGVVQSELLALELAGRVTAVAGGYQRR